MLRTDKSHTKDSKRFLGKSDFLYRSIFDIQMEGQNKGKEYLGGSS